MSPPRALFLDLDETLLDRRYPVAIVRTCAELARLHPELDAARLWEANSTVWNAYWPEVEARWILGSVDGAAVSREGWRRALRKCGVTDESVVERAARTHRRESCDAYRQFDDVGEFVASAMARGVPLALITNGARDSQRDKLSALGMDHWFEAVVISGEIGIGKPDPRIFELALDRLSVGGEVVWHVGDSLAADVAGAKAAGLTAVWLNRAGTGRKPGDPEPDIEINSLSELMPNVPAPLRGR